MKETITKKWNEKKHRQWIEKEYQETGKIDAKDLTMKEWIEKEYQETLSNHRYRFIVCEIEKLAFPSWLQRISS